MLDAKRRLIHGCSRLSELDVDTTPIRGGKKDETSTGKAVEVLAKELGLTDEDLEEMLPSGIQSTFVTRVGWASTYMKKAGLLEATRRGYFRITSRGQELLKMQPKAINVKLLKQYPEFLEFKKIKEEEVPDHFNISLFSKRGIRNCRFLDFISFCLFFIQKSCPFNVAFL